MANGVAVALPGLPAETKPAAVPGSTPTRIERAIGEAVAAATTGLCYAMAEFQNGGLRSATKAENGARIARLYWLQQAHAGEIDFPAVAREQGRIVLRQYLATDDFHRHYSTEQGDTALDLFINETLAILSRVTEFERSLMS